ncbi:hypothetical protein JQK87_06630 [Streptomyces sp. G44]|nr:hypothetical protein [Streptomyces sp. G44]
MSTYHRPRKAVLLQPVESALYTSFAFTAHLLEACINASIGTVGDALDNALMESKIGLYKTELIKPRKPRHGLVRAEVTSQFKGADMMTVCFRDILFGTGTL